MVMKSTPRFTTYPSLVLIRLVLTEIQRFKNVKINKEMYGRTRSDAVFGQLPDGHTFFVNFDIFKWLYLAYYWVYIHQTWGLCKALSTIYDYVDQ